MDLIEEYTDRVVKVLVYIDEHLDEKITIDDLAKVACYSSFHFHRVFQAIVGETLHQYVKRTRLEKAAAQLRYSEKPVTNIALDSGYETPSSFAKAFRQMMNESPKQYRIMNDAVKDIKQVLKELPMVDVDEVTEINDIDILFVRKTGSYKTSPWEAWKGLIEFLEENNIEHKGLRKFSISLDDPNITEEENLRFDACVQVPNGFNSSGGIGRRKIKGGKYAVFTHIGPIQTLRGIFTSIMMRWLPATENRYDDSRKSFCERFDQELLDTHPEKMRTLLYIPLR